MHLSKLSLTFAALSLLGMASAAQAPVDLQRYIPQSRYNTFTWKVMPQQANEKRYRMEIEAERLPLKISIAVQLWKVNERPKDDWRQWYSSSKIQRWDGMVSGHKPASAARRFHFYGYSRNLFFPAKGNSYLGNRCRFGSSEGRVTVAVDMERHAYAPFGVKPTGTWINKAEVEQAENIVNDIMNELIKAGLTNAPKLP